MISQIPTDQIPAALELLEVISVELEMEDNDLMGVTLHDINGKNVFTFRAISLWTDRHALLEVHGGEK